jgi:hypothetical protein
VVRRLEQRIWEGLPFGYMGGMIEARQVGAECLPAKTQAGDQKCLHKGAGIGEPRTGAFRTCGSGFQARVRSAFSASHGYGNRAAPERAATGAANPEMARSSYNFCANGGPLGGRVRTPSICDSLDDLD